MKSEIISHKIKIKINHNKIKLEVSDHDKRKIYESYGLSYSPMFKFDYSSISEWCRYCGSRHSSKFYDTKIGPKSLCDIHYKNYQQNNLNIEELCGIQKPLYPNEMTEMELLKKSLQLTHNQ